MHLLDYFNSEGPPTALFEIAPPVREFVSFGNGQVVHARDGERTLCARECEGFGNDLDAELWKRCPALRCQTCARRVEAQ